MASMGVYVFYVESRQANILTRMTQMWIRSNDFGKNIIPAMLAGGEKLYAYPFSGLLEGRRDD